MIAAAVLVPLFACGFGAFLFFFVVKRGPKGENGEKETPYEAWMRTTGFRTNDDSSATGAHTEAESTLNPMVSRDITGTLSPNSTISDEETTMEEGIPRQNVAEGKGQVVDEQATAPPLPSAPPAHAAVAVKEVTVEEGILKQEVVESTHNPIAPPLPTAPPLPE